MLKLAFATHYCDTDGKQLIQGGKMAELPRYAYDGVTFFTCANPAYEDFFLLYAASTLFHIEKVIVEVGFEDVQMFIARNRGGLAVLKKYFGPGRIIMRNAAFERNGCPIFPNTVRFLETPRPTEYVYIGDIDIITLDDRLIDRHLNFMERRALPYSNSIREVDPSKMSGLHFVRYQDWYPLPDVSDIDLQRTVDEQVLRIICERSGLHVQDEEWFRPMPGIHISPNRRPMGEVRHGKKMPGWGIEPYKQEYRLFLKSKVFEELHCFLSERIKKCLSRINSIISH